MNEVIAHVHRPTSTLDLEGSAARVSTFLAVPAVTSAVVTWGKRTSAAEAPVTTVLHFHCDLTFLNVNWISQLFDLSLCFWDNKYFPCLLIYLSVSVTPSPSAPPVRLCPPLCSPEDANINLFTAAGFLSYIQSTTRRAYQQVLEALDDSHRRWLFFCFVLVGLLPLLLLLHLKGTEYSPAHYIHCTNRYLDCNL